MATSNNAYITVTLVTTVTPKSIQVPLAHMVHLHLILGARLHGAPQSGGAPEHGVNTVQSPHIGATLDAPQEHSSHPSNFVGA